MSRHLFSTKVVERWFSILSQPPVLKQRGEWKKGAGTEKKVIMEAGEKDGQREVECL